VVSKPNRTIAFDPLDAESMEDLKRLGSYREVRRLLQDRVGPHLRIRARGWQDLLALVEHVREAGEEIAQARRKERMAKGHFFVSDAAELIYGLLYLEGDAKSAITKITPRHFSDRKLAKRWRDHALGLVHPDRCDHVDAGRAAAVVNKLYPFMLERAR